MTACIQEMGYPTQKFFICFFANIMPLVQVHYFNYINHWQMENEKW